MGVSERPPDRAQRAKRPGVKMGGKSSKKGDQDGDDADERGGEPVLLHIYKPTNKGLPNITGFRVYHTGVEVYGSEYTFAGGEAKLSGVYPQRPKSAPPTSGWEFSETMEIGRTDISKEQLKLLVNELKPQYPQNSYDLVANAPSTSGWDIHKAVEIGRTGILKQQLKLLVNELKPQYPQNSYDLVAKSLSLSIQNNAYALFAGVTYLAENEPRDHPPAGRNNLVFSIWLSEFSVYKNCNHFSNEFCERLTGQSIPAWVNRAARVGNMVSNLLPEVKKDENETANADQGPAGAASSANDYIPPAKQNVDLINFIDRERCGCLNAAAEHPLSNILTQWKGPTKKSAFGKADLPILKSDADEQLLIYVPFKRKVKLHSFSICAPSDDSSPRVIKIFKNQPNLDFDEASDVKNGDFDEAIDSPPVHTITLNKPEQRGDMEHFQQNFEVAFVKWQDVTFVTIFIEENFGSDFSVLSNLTFYGRLD